MYMAGKFGLTEAARTPTSTHLLHRIVSERCDRGFLLFKLSAALDNLESGSWNYAILEASFIANHLMEAVDQFQFGGKSLPNSYKEARIDRNADLLDGFKEDFSVAMHFIRQSEALVIRGTQAYQERALRCVRSVQEICAALGIEIEE
jgi:hypothetical protein